MTKPGLVKSSRPARPSRAGRPASSGRTRRRPRARLSSVETSAIGTLRKATTIIIRVSSSTNPMTSGSRSRCCSASRGTRPRPPPTATRRRTAVERGRYQVVAEQLRAASSTRSSDSSNGIASVEHGRAPVLGDLDRRGAGVDEIAGGGGQRPRSPSAARHVGLVARGGADDHVGDGALGRELLGDRLERLHLGDVAGQRVEGGGVRSSCPSAGTARAATTAPATRGRRPGAGAPGRARGADAALADPAVEPPQQRHPRAVHPPAQLGQQRRQHGDRAEHRDRRPPGSSRWRGELKVASPTRYRPAIEAITAPPETRMECPEVCGRDLDGVAGGAARGPLLALPLEVEQRVVDADGHADQHDHAGHRGLGRHQVGQRRG